MRRIMLLMAVVVLMVVMMVVSPMPAFAVGQAPCGIGAGESGVATSSSPGYVGSATSQFAQNPTEGGNPGPNIGQDIAFVPSPYATQCNQGGAVSPSTAK
jgi:hypothetical protein